MSMASKISILVQEATRRVRNCSVDIPWETKVKHVNKLMCQMVWSGYSQKVREIVARRSLAKLESDWDNLETLGRSLYRSREQRRQTQKADKTNWFRSMGATTTITIPTTKNSELAKRLKLTLASVPGPIGTSVKVLERPGRPIMSGLSSNNPFPKASCNREDCPWVPSGKTCKRRCSRENIIYKATCSKCERQQIEAGIPEKEIIHSMYIGETSRTLYVRHKQHRDDYRKASKSNINLANLPDLEESNVGFM